MAEQTGVKVKGLREINRALKTVGVPRKEITAAAKKAANVVILEAKSLTPVRSGKLRDSIRPGTRRGGITIMAGNNTTIPYANPIHWGWFRRRIAPQPFLAKALGYNRDEIYQAYFEQLERLITEQYSKMKVS